MEKTAWYREPELLLLVLLVVGVYFSRFDQPSLRGEETRWAGCAREHLMTGDWVVARQQGLVHPDRPPLVNWLIAGCMLVLGTDSILAVRLPSMLSTLATVVLIYAYGRVFLSRAGALSAAAAYATMIQVMTFGRVAESEAVFTLCLAASLIVWHWGYSRNWPKLAVWCSGYALAALATLAKGPQAPVYFGGTVFVYLLLVQRDWRYLLHPSHLAGIATFAVILGMWQVPYYLATDWESVRLTWCREVGKRFDLTQPTVLLKHLIEFPGKVLACMFPWSLMLGACLVPGFWRRLQAARPHVLYLLTAIVISFLPLWTAQGAKSRYFMPLYPCFALLIGLTIQRCWETGARGLWQSSWRRFVIGHAAAMVIAGIAVIVASLVPQLSRTPLAQPLGFALVYATGCGLLAGVLWRSWIRLPIAADPPLWQCRAGILAIAAFLGLTLSGLSINTHMRTSVDVDSAVSEVKHQLPADVHLVSFERTHHRFAWHYGDFIPAFHWPYDESGVPEGMEYFCVERSQLLEHDLPFDWQEVACINCERNHRGGAENLVIIGRRLPATATAALARQHH